MVAWLMLKIHMQTKKICSKNSILFQRQTFEKHWKHGHFWQTFEWSKIHETRGRCIHLWIYFYVAKYFGSFWRLIWCFLEVTCLSKFLKMGWARGNQPKLLKMVVDLLMDRLFLSKFSFSGKSIGQKKNSFKDRSNIVELLYAITSHIDRNYEKTDFVSHLRDKILKYAGE